MISYPSIHTASNFVFWLTLLILMVDLFTKKLYRPPLWMLWSILGGVTIAFQENPSPWAILAVFMYGACFQIEYRKHQIESALARAAAKNEVN